MQPRRESVCRRSTQASCFADFAISDKFVLADILQHEVIGATTGFVRGIHVKGVLNGYHVRHSGSSSAKNRCARSPLLVFLHMQQHRMLELLCNISERILHTQRCIAEKLKQTITNELAMYNTNSNDHLHHMSHAISVECGILVSTCTPGPCSCFSTVECDDCDR